MANSLRESSDLGAGETDASAREVDGKITDGHHRRRRFAVLPADVEHWSLTTLREKLVKIGARVVRHGRYLVFQLAEVGCPKPCSPRSCVGAASDALGLACCTGGAQTQPSTTGIWEMSVNRGAEKIPLGRQNVRTN